MFDLDGTLLDTLEDIADSVNIGLDRLGFPGHDVEAYKYFIGDGVEELAFQALPDDQRHTVTVVRLVAAVREEYRKRWADKTRAYDGIPELLDGLTARGVKMAILSNKPDNFTRLAVSHLLPCWEFSPVIGAQASIPRKPDPAAALQIAERLNIPPGKFIYLGDGDTDMRTALAAGMYPVGALWGFRSGDELAASGARALIEKPTDLLNLI